MIDKGWAAVLAYRSKYPHEDGIRRGWDCVYWNGGDWAGIDGFDEGVAAAEADIRWLERHGLISKVV